jgi:tRNA modification GTPase
VTALSVTVTIWFVSAMHLRVDDTIGALASAPGPAARGIVRISGPDALGCLASWFEPVDASRWKSARGASAHAGGLRLDGLRTPLDAIVCAWPNARSYTGQPLVEIHVLGSPPLLEAILGRAFEARVRPARPGEFTLRAFLGGRIDLLQAEAVLGVIDAAGDATLTAALRQLAGGISGRMTQVRGELIDLLADLEAGLDFVDDGIEFVSRDHLVLRIRRCEESVEALLIQCQTRSQSLGRRRVVLAGLPNAGKSMLFNALLTRDAALVSSTAGTTRDYLSGTLEWSGIPVELIDTAGWETDGRDELSKIRRSAGPDGLMGLSQELSAERRKEADLLLWCSPVDLSETARSEDTRVRSRESQSGRPTLIVCTKSDLIGRPPAGNSESAAIFVSAQSGDGLGLLIDRCARILREAAPEGAEIIGTTAARCHESLATCRDALAHAAEAAQSRMGDEIVALELRDSLEHLGRMLGTVYTDDILDRIFSRFCIGK